MCPKAQKILPMKAKLLEDATTDWFVVVEKGLRRGKNDSLI